jgi:hypothetical protein
MEHITHTRRISYSTTSRKALKEHRVKPLLEPRSPAHLERDLERV